MHIRVTYNNQEYRCNLDEPIDISIDLADAKCPLAFGAPAVKFYPLEEGNFIGSLEKGSPVNFYNVHINPHGNGTHTETALHIDSRAPNLFEVLKKTHMFCNVITIESFETRAQDDIVGMTSYNWDGIDFHGIDAIAIRTNPNTALKKTNDYTGTNPPYMSATLAAYLSGKIDHLLIDLPSVDKEHDGGELSSHKHFWQTETSDPVYNKTITELIYIDDEVEDGLYLLNIQALSWHLDTSPSRPVLYRLNKI